MSAIAILTGLLVVAYFGSILVGGRALRGFGLPSGTEFLLLGILLGPMVFGVISDAALASFEPLTVIALAWIALTIGLHYGTADGRKLSRRGLVLGITFALATLVFTALAVGSVAYLIAGLRGKALWVLALGVGCVSSETTRYAVRWVVERYKATGPLADLLADLSDADDVVPLTALGLVFALGDAPTGLHIDWSAWLSFGSTLAVGGILGATAAALIDIEARPNQRWGILLGTALLGMGAAMRLGQSAVSAMLMMGLTLAALSKEAPELRAMVSKTERPVVLPALVLAGAEATYPQTIPFIAVGLIALAARVGAKLLLGSILRRQVAPESPAIRERLSGSMGLVLMPSGILTIIVGLSCALRFPGPTGQLILSIATVSGLLGELVGPAKLRAELRRAGEIADDALSTRDPMMQAPAFASAPAQRTARTSFKSLPPPPQRPRERKST